MPTPKAQSRKVRISSPYALTHRFKVSEDFVGKSLASMMAQRFPFRSADLWHQKIEEGSVGINNAPSSPSYILMAKDEVYHHNPRVVEPSVPDEVMVIEETIDYVIVNKPAPMPMHPGGRYNKNTLTKVLEDAGYTDLKIVHRLDGVTSGLVLFARNKAFAQKAMHCFRDGKVEKAYFAHVSGLPVNDEQTIDAPIRRKVGFVFESDDDLENAKSAITHFEVYERRQDSAIIKCRPITGRTHQIRLHLEKWGHPIIDDPIYGLEGDKSSRQAQNRGIRLINASLKIEELGVDLELELPDYW